MVFIPYLFCLSLWAQDPEAAAADAQPVSTPARGSSLGEVLRRIDMRPTDLILKDTVLVFLNLDRENRLISAPSPVINMFGIGTVFPILGEFSLSPALDVYSSYYGWTGSRALMVLDENRTATVTGFILNIPLSYRIDFNPVHRLSLGAGPSLVMRSAALAKAVPEDEQPSIDAINDYLWAQGRWFYPEFSLVYSYAAAPWVRFGAGVRCLFPVFNGWSGESIPWADNMIVGGGIWVSFSNFWRELDLKALFKPKPKVERLSPREEDQLDDEAATEDGTE